MKVSVVIPFYNLERYVRPCLDSVIAAVEKEVERRGGGGQRTAPFSVEVICVDDGSTDGTGRILDSYASSPIPHPSSLSLSVIHKPNGGEGSARNEGIAAASGEWVTFLDGDDVWLENHLSVAVPLLLQNPDADLVALKYESFDDGMPPPAPPAQIPSAKVFDTTRSLNSEVMLEIGVFPTFFRRPVLEKKVFSSLPLGADRLFVAQELAVADKVVKCDVAVHGYRVRANSMARAVWNARKVMSQCDYAYGSLCALADSHKALGCEGHAYLASIWLSDVPNRAQRLPSAERNAVAAKWVGTLDDAAVVVGLPLVDRIRRLLLSVGRRSPSLALRMAWLFRKGGLT